MAESEARKKYRREWAAAHRERGNVARRRWALANPEKERLLRANYRVRNIEKITARNTAWRAANPEKIRDINLRRKGWTLQQFNIALKVQKFRCAICNIDLRSLPQKQVHADHCHLSGRRRDVLCHHCNAGLGAFRDTPKLLMAARAYLLKRRR
jgi:hypothetical protein